MQHLAHLQVARSVADRRGAARLLRDVAELASAAARDGAELPTDAMRRRAIGAAYAMHHAAAAVPEGPPPPPVARLLAAYPPDTASAHLAAWAEDLERYNRGGREVVRRLANEPTRVTASRPAHAVREMERLRAEIEGFDRWRDGWLIRAAHDLACEIYRGRWPDRGAATLRALAGVVDPYRGEDFAAIFPDAPGLVLEGVVRGEPGRENGEDAGSSVAPSPAAERTLREPPRPTPNPRAVAAAFDAGTAAHGAAGVRVGVLRQADIIRREVPSYALHLAGGGVSELLVTLRSAAFIQVPPVSDWADAYAGCLFAGRADFSGLPDAYHPAAVWSPSVLTADGLTPAAPPALAFLTLGAADPGRVLVCGGESPAAVAAWIGAARSAAALLPGPPHPREPAAAWAEHLLNVTSAAGLRETYAGTWLGDPFGAGWAAADGQRERRPAPAAAAAAGATTPPADAGPPAGRMALAVAAGPQPETVDGLLCFPRTPGVRLDEVKRRAAVLAERDPGFVAYAASAAYIPLAKRLGCGKTTAEKLKNDLGLRESAGGGRRGRPRRLTDAALAAVPDASAVDPAAEAEARELERLMAEQRRDGEASPLDPAGLSPVVHAGR